MYEHSQVPQLKDLTGHFLDPDCSSHLKSTEPKKKRQRSPGQVVVEYVFLLIFAVAIAGIAVKGCVKRDPSEAGSVIAFWDGLLQTIGKDLADEANPN